MTQKPVSVQSAESVRKSGTLCLYLLEEPGEGTETARETASPKPPPAVLKTPESAETHATVTPLAPRLEPPYARFRLCRGFIDDLNRILPIRLRIQLESELANGRKRGKVEGLLRFRWEFLES